MIHLCHSPISSMVRTGCARQVRTYCLLFGLAVASGAIASESKKHFTPDAPGTPAYTLPDPLVATDGRRITTAQEWNSVRRPELLELFRSQVYGRVPATRYETSFQVREDKQAMGGAATLKRVQIRITSEGKSLTFDLSLFVPNRGPKPVPAFLLINNRGLENIDPTREKKSEFWPAEEVIARGYAVAAFYNAQLDPDDKKDVEFKDGIHAVLDRGPRAPDAWATLAAWAWGASRCMDYFETDRDIAKDKVAVVGHSRGGKTALWAAAEDQRFAIACSNDSGCGGAGLFHHRTKEKETIAVINRSFPHWFDSNFKQYNGRESELPFDQHMLIALIAPRGVCVHSASQDLWADPRGEYLSLAGAGPVYRLFGLQGLGSAPEMPATGEELNGDAAQYYLRDGKHDLTLEDWNAYLDFADRWYRRAGGQTKK